jgi:hypothetical protein
MYRWRYSCKDGGIEPVLQQWSEPEHRWLYLKTAAQFAEQDDDDDDDEEDDLSDFQAPAFPLPVPAAEHITSLFLPTYAQQAPAPARQDTRTFPTTLQPPIELDDAALRRTVLYDPFVPIQPSPYMQHQSHCQPPMDRGDVLRRLVAKNEESLYNEPVHDDHPFQLPAVGSGWLRPNISRLPSTTARRPANTEKTWEQVRAETPLIPQKLDDYRHYFNESEAMEDDTSKAREAPLDEFWNSGFFAQARQKEFAKHHLAASNKSDDPAAVTAASLLVPMFENLQWHQTQSRLNSRTTGGQAGKNGSWKAPLTPGALAVGGKDYWAPWVAPPEWCIDRSMTMGSVSSGNTIGGKGALSDKTNKVQTFFGEMEWVKAPERVGRDPRYRPLLQTRGSNDGGRKTGAMKERRDSVIGLHMGRFG